MIRLIPDWTKAYKLLSIQFPLFLSTVVVPAWLMCSPETQEAIKTSIGQFVGGTDNVGPAMAWAIFGFQIVLRLIQQQESKE